MKIKNPTLILIISLLFVSCVPHSKIGIESFEISKTDIQNQLKKDGSASSYDVLVNRFVNLDTTLTEQEIKLLYYGQLLLPGFSGYESVDFTLVYENLKEKKLEVAQTKLDSILKISPINLTANYLRAYISEEIEPDKNNTRKRIILLNKLYDAILSTGDGEDLTNAIDVVSIADEYFICYRVLFTGDVIGQSLVNKKARAYDKLKVEPNKNYKKDEVWFDVTTIFGKY